MIDSQKITQRQLRHLVPYARNSRTHSDEQVSQIMASIREWGWTNPVLVTDAGMIVAGHGRVLAAERLGLKSVPCIEVSGWTEAQIRAYVIADNKLALNAGWDEEMLKIELLDLTHEEFNLDLTGFSADEINILMNGWQSDIDPIQKHGENLDGIAVTIKIRVDAAEETMAKEAITNALDAAGITYEFG